MPLLRVSLNGKVIDFSKDQKIGHQVHADFVHLYHQPIQRTIIPRGRSGKAKIFTEEEIANYQTRALGEE